MRSVDAFDRRDSGARRPVSGKSGTLLSDKQKNVLRKAGYDPTQLPYGYAKILVGRILDKWFPNRNANQKETINGKQKVPT